MKKCVLKKATKDRQGQCSGKKYYSSQKNIIVTYGAMGTDEFILSEFKKIMRRKAGADVIDLDEGFYHKFSFTIQKFSDILKDTKGTIPPNRWSYHRIGLVKKGFGEFTTGIYDFKAPKNTLLVFPSRVITSSRNWEPDSEGYFVLFNMDFFIQNNFPYKNVENKKVLTGCCQPYLYITDRQAEEINTVFETIFRERKEDGIDRNELIAVKISELLVLCERMFEEQLHFDTNMPALDVIKKFSDLVENNFTTERTVRFYAEQLNMHPNYLNSLIKKNTGLTAKVSIQNRLLLEAKYLLHSTNLSIKEIAHRVGFNDPDYFTSFFTRLEKISPGHYRSSFI